jgi:ferrous iron transport protein A
MTLSEMTENSQYRVVSAAVDNPEIQSRLYALGVYPGVTIEILRFAPTGNPIQIRIGRSLLSIRKSEAQLISVEQST